MSYYFSQLAQAKSRAAHETAEAWRRAAWQEFWFPVTGPWLASGHTDGSLTRPLGEPRVGW